MNYFEVTLLSDATYVPSKNAGISSLKIMNDKHLIFTLPADYDQILIVSSITGTGKLKFD